MKRTRNFVIIGYIVLGLVCLFVFPLLIHPELLSSDVNGIGLLEYPLYFLLMLVFFVGLVLIVGGTTNDKTPLKRTFERFMMRFKQKTH